MIAPPSSQHIGQIQRQSDDTAPNAPRASTAVTRHSVFFVPDEAFEDENVLGMVSGKSPAAQELRERARQADQDAERYVRILEDSSQLVGEVKSALYDADHSGQAHGAEVLLEEVGHMIKRTATESLPEAAQLQSSAEQWLGYRRKMTPHIKANHAILEDLFRRRKQHARTLNESSRVECDRSWKQVRDCEAELDHLPRIKTERRARDKDMAAADKPTDGLEVGGLTTDGAQALLAAFAVVLGPHVQHLAARNPGRQTPEEKAAMEFLHACRDAGRSTGQQSPQNTARLSLGSLGIGPEDGFDQSPLLSPGFADEAETLVKQLGGF